MSAPALSVALLAATGFDGIRRTCACIAGQDVADEIELLVLAPRAAPVRADAAIAARLHSLRVLDIDLAAGGGVARAMAVRAASAPLIAFAEDHCYPQAGWARALIEAHRGPWAAVGPEVVSANPGTLVSDADLLMGYGPWLAPQRPGERAHLPGHNTCYKRTELLALGARLARWMEAETPLQWQMLGNGRRLYLAPEARVAHTNFERFGTWIVVSFHAGRVFAATRALPWPNWKRWAFAAASPVVPFARLRRHLAQARLAGWSIQHLARVTPVLLVGLLVDGVGQAVGVLAGGGGSRAALALWECARNAPSAHRAGA